MRNTIQLEPIKPSCTNRKKRRTKEILQNHFYESGVQRMQQPTATPSTKAAVAAFCVCSHLENEIRNRFNNQPARQLANQPTSQTRRCLSPSLADSAELVTAPGTGAYRAAFLAHSLGSCCRCIMPNENEHWQLVVAHALKKKHNTHTDTHRELQTESESESEQRTNYFIYQFHC